MTRPQAKWSIAASSLLLVFAVILQLRAGRESLGADLAGADPPAHFTTGVLLYDYVRHLPPRPPLPFAECFYVRYPKVALGHWPPAFYIAECLWFLCFGTSADAARAMCAVVAAGLAIVLGHHTSRHWGICSGLVAAAVLLAYPSMQNQAWRVMSDIFLALMVYLALVDFGEWLAAGASRNLWRSSLWTFLAILTKGTGWLLFVVVLTAPVLAGRNDRYRERAYWLCITLPLVAAAPFFLYTDSLHFSYPIALAHRIAALGTSAIALATLIGLLFIIAAIAYALPRRLPSKHFLPVYVPVVLWVGAQLSVRLMLSRITHEWDRFFIPSLAPALFLLTGIISGFAARVTLWRLTAGMIAPILGACAMPFCGLASVLHVTGYGAAMDSIPIRESGPVIWIQSDPTGEGASIVRRLETDHARSAYVLRGSKMLSDSSWSGGGYRLLLETPDAVDRLLEEIPVDFILFDASVSPTPDSKLLLAYLSNSSSKFSLRNAYPVRGRSSEGEVRVYQRRLARLPGPIKVSVRLDPERGHRAITCGSQ